MRYFKFPKWLKRFFPGAIWDFSFSDNGEKTLYLTFDDGPNPDTTEWLLNLLDHYHAKATFFCLGQNVEKYPTLFRQLTDRGHTVGNHSYSHINGFFTTTKVFMADVEKAMQIIPSKLFRPPYGKLTPKQYRILERKGLKTVFWSYISYDFDPTLDSEKRVENALKYVKHGSVIVFHDSDKAFPQLKTELPLLMKTWANQDYNFKSIDPC